MPTFQTPRGTSDILPSDQPYWKLVSSTVESLAQRYGYRRIDTPIFEDTGLFVRGVGQSTDIVEKEMYSFMTKGGDALTLRPEATASFCRAYLQHGMQNLPQPVKLFTVGPFFRHDRPGAGRYRQFHQVNFECIGEADPAVDAEVIQLAWELYATLGLRDLSVLLNSIGCPNCRPAYLDALRQYYAPLVEELCRECQARLERNPLRLLDCKNPTCQALSSKAPRSVDFLCEACADHFSRLGTYLGLLGVPFEVSHRLVRGLDYYTRTVFEVIPPDATSQGTIGGGGRYDGLIEQIGGPATPGIGFASGVERVILNLRNQGIAALPIGKTLLYIAPIGETAREFALPLLKRARQDGIPTVIGLGSRSLKSQLKQASSQQVPFVAIIGEEEIGTNEVTLRDLRTGEQKKISVQLLGPAVREMLAGPGGPQP